MAGVGINVANRWSSQASKRASRGSPSGSVVHFNGSGVKVTSTPPTVIVT